MKKDSLKFSTFLPLWINYKSESLLSNPNKLETGPSNSVDLDYPLCLANLKLFTMAFSKNTQIQSNSEIHSNTKFKSESNLSLNLQKIITSSNFLISPKRTNSVFNHLECFKFLSHSFLLNVQDTFVMFW